jgi:hypothetical protein
MSNISFGEYVLEYYIPDMNTQWKGSTLLGHIKRIKNHLIPAFGVQILKTISLEAVAGFFDRLYLETPLAASTVDNLRVQLGKILDHTVQNHYLKKLSPQGLLASKSAERNVGCEKRADTNRIYR